jgi:hypothetical protein
VHISELGWSVGNGMFGNGVIGTGFMRLCNGTVCYRLIRIGDFFLSGFVL